MALVVRSRHDDAAVLTVNGIRWKRRALMGDVDGGYVVVNAGMESYGGCSRGAFMVLCAEWCDVVIGWCGGAVMSAVGVCCV